MKYAVRADHTRKVYQVYEIANGRTIKSFYYRSGKEIARGIAHGRANLTRDALNRELKP